MKISLHFTQQMSSRKNNMQVYKTQSTLDVNNMCLNQYVSQLTTFFNTPVLDHVLTVRKRFQKMPCSLTSVTESKDNVGIAGTCTWELQAAADPIYARCFPCWVEKFDGGQQIPIHPNTSK